MELEPERKISATNGNLESSGLDKQLESEDTSCEDLLKYVKEKLDKFEMENRATTDERRRRFGQVSRKPNLGNPNEQGKLYPTSFDSFTRMTSDPGPSKRRGSHQQRKKSSSIDIMGTPNLVEPPLSPDARYDISGQTSENRFPWLKDQGVQCDLNADKEEPKKRAVGELALPNSECETPRKNRSQSQSAM